MFCFFIPLQLLSLTKQSALRTYPTNVTQDAKTGLYWHLWTNDIIQFFTNAPDDQNAALFTNNFPRRRRPALRKPVQQNHRPEKRLSNSCEKPRKVIEGKLKIEPTPHAYTGTDTKYSCEAYKHTGHIP